MQCKNKILRRNNLRKRIFKCFFNYNFEQLKTVDAPSNMNSSAPNRNKVDALKY